MGNRGKLVKQLVFMACLLGALTLPACSKKREAAPVSTVKVEPTLPPSDAALDPKESDSQKFIGENTTQPAYLVRFKKEAWLGRDLWISLGVERASVTGLALTVMGYVPAKIKREGNFLVLERKNKGLFGGSVLGPEIPLNSYPIVSEDSDTLLVDLSQAQNPFALTVFGFHAGKNATAELSTRLSYTKNVAISETSLSFTNVLTARSPIPLFEEGDGSPEDEAGLDPYVLSATLRMDWVLELESPTFSPFKNTFNLQGLFLENPLITGGGLTTDVFVNKIDTLKPFVWQMSASTPLEYREAVSQGILAWNEGLGGEVLQVKVAEGPVDFTDIHTSNIIWDDNLAIGMAFANWRSNPYTGEIVQAQVYMSGRMWAENSKTVYRYRRVEEKVRKALDEARNKPKPAPAPGSWGPPATSNPGVILALKAELRALEKTLNSQNHAHSLRSRKLSLNFNTQLAEHSQEKAESFCVRSVGDEYKIAREDLENLGDMIDLIETQDPTPPVVGPPAPGTEPLPAFAERHSPYPAPDKTEIQFSKDIVRGVVMHEIGHTLGLRHNFKGSTRESHEGKIQSASIMDYNDLVVDGQFNRPGEGDISIMAQVYPVPNKEKLKSFPFCTDGDISKKEANCQMHDYGPSTVDGAIIGTESNLLMAKFFLDAGHPAGLRFLIRALSTWAQTLNTLHFATERGEYLSFGVNFQKEQENAWELYEKMKGLLGIVFEDEIKEALQTALSVGLSGSVTQAAKTSALYPKVLSELESIALDENEKSDSLSRFAALEGLVRVQDFSARAKLRNLVSQLERRLNTATVRDPLAAEEDLEILARAKKILDSGYLILE